MKDYHPIQGGGVGVVMSKICFILQKGKANDKPPGMFNTLDGQSIPPSLPLLRVGVPGIYATIPYVLRNFLV